MTASLIWLSLLVAQTETERGTLEAVEGERGGRHWIDQKTQPPKSPTDSLKCFGIEPGAKIELIAAEPLVMDPVAIAFDHPGRMFVVEYGDYPTGPENPADPPLSRVVLLENALNDGRPVKRHVFADNLKFAHSLMPLLDGILVGAQTQIIFLKDTDGDNIADVREVWFDGFTPAHPQMQIGNPRWGFDNRVYLNYGLGKVRMTRPGFPASEPVDMPRSDFWFDPLTMEFGPAGGLGQFGNTIDHRGYRFFTTNRNPIMVNMIPPEAVKRNPFAIISKTYTDVGPSGGDTRVYPLVDMKSNYLSHAGTHTSACGVTAYLGDLFDGDYRDSVFVCEPIGHLVTRTIVTPDPNSVGLIATRAREKADFLASTDTWFRPASLATGPDGALYLADMYRLWVEHPKFLPDDIAKRIDWRAGEDRGRIWRITPAGKNRAFTTIAPGREMENLGHANGWHRETARRRIVELQDNKHVSVLRNAISKVRRDQPDSSQFGLNCLMTLAGISEVTRSDVVPALSSPDADYQRHAVRLVAPFLDDHGEFLDLAVSTISPTGIASGSPQVRFQLALSLGESSDPQATSMLRRLAVQDGHDPWMATAIVSSCRDRSAEVAAVLKYLDADSFAQRSQQVPFDLVRQLAEVTAARGNIGELRLLLKSLGDERTATWWRMATVTGLKTALPRHRGDLAPISLAKLLNAPPEALAPHVPALKTVLQRSRLVALSNDAGVVDRTTAIQLVTALPSGESRETFEQLLQPDQPAAIQQAAIATLQQSGVAFAAELVLAKWSQLGPGVRGSALGLLMSRTNSTKQALQAMADGTVPAAVVDIDRRVRLLKHRDEAIRSLASKLFGGAISANRRAVAQKYEAALSSPVASAKAGAAVFQKTCIKCHKLDGRGADVGPDISDVRNRSREALLFDILDPNRKVEPRFMDYSVVTNDGRTFNGLMVSETSEAVVLRQAEGKQQVIPRNDIDIVKASGRSLMPEGVEKDVTVQQMADLLEFLKARERPALLQ